ncbi:hypothetical protein OAB47_06250 [Vicingaceae bacterium]|nr:hypothetical protein [Vicingaceae bacterium]
MYKSFFDLVDEAQSDGDVDAKEILDLMKNFELMRPQLKKVEIALKQLGKTDLAKKVDELDDSLFIFFQEINECFILSPRPKGLFKSKKKERWKFHRAIKENLRQWVDSYNSVKQ